MSDWEQRRGDEEFVYRTTHRDVTVTERKAKAVTAGEDRKDYSDGDRKDMAKSGQALALEYRKDLAKGALRTPVTRECARVARGGRRNAGTPRLRCHGRQLLRGRFVPRAARTRIHYPHACRGARRCAEPVARDGWQRASTGAHRPQPVPVPGRPRLAGAGRARPERSGRAVAPGEDECWSDRPYVVCVPVHE
jgi:hypothetical protein